MRHWAGADRIAGRFPEPRPLPAWLGPRQGAFAKFRVKHTPAPAHFVLSGNVPRRHVQRMEVPEKVWQRNVKKRPCKGRHRNVKVYLLNRQPQWNQNGLISTTRPRVISRIGWSMVVKLILFSLGAGTAILARVVVKQTVAKPLGKLLLARSRGFEPCQ